MTTKHRLLASCMFALAAAKVAPAAAAPAQADQANRALACLTWHSDCNIGPDCCSNKCDSTIFHQWCIS